ncbi:hypothetical protein BRD00_00790 [Halobacteriales archaeon QS_8_69_26]|nr:MAG: hypothetical protein BRD00_00790 [Halobacteriales archaeon QS_8_69_26]
MSEDAGPAGPPEPGWTDPVPWDCLLATTGRSEMAALETFERHRGDLDGDTAEGDRTRVAVEFDPGERSPSVTSPRR